MKKKSEPGKRQLQTAANRKKIIETARELFKENGFESTTMSDIIEATGLSNGTIYNLFPSKNDILYEIYMSYINIPLHLNDDYETKVLHPIESILDFSVKYINLWIDSGWSIAMNVYRAFSSKPEAAEYTDVNSLLRGQIVKTELREFIEHAQEAGTMISTISAEEIENLLSTHERGMLYLWGLLKGQYDFIGEAKKQFPVILSPFIK